MNSNKKNRSTRKSRLLASAIALGLCTGFVYSPAYADYTHIVEALSEVSDEIITDGSYQVVAGTTYNIRVENGRQIVNEKGKANNTILYNESRQEVNGLHPNSQPLNGATSNTATACDTRLYNRSNQTLFYGGIANNSVLFEDSSQTVWDGGIANNAILNNNSFQKVQFGGIANDTILNHNSSQLVEQADVYRTVLNNGAKQLVKNEGIATDTKLYDQSTQSIGELNSGETGGTVYDTELYDSSHQNILYGTAINTKLYDQATQTVSGLENYDAISGAAYDTELNDSSHQTVWYGGTAHNTVLNGSTRQDVLIEGTVNSTTLNDDSYQWLRTGTANDTILNDNALQHVVKRTGQYWTNGTAYRTTVNGNAAMVVEAAAVAYDTTVNGGTLYVYENAVLKNDNVAFGAAVKINSGGTLAAVESGAAIDGHVIMQGGTIAFMREGTDYTNSLAGLTVSAGNGYKTLTINGDLTGNGNFAMSTDVVAKTSDHLLVTGNVTGAYQVIFTNDATASANGTEIVPDIIMPADGTGVFNGQVEYGGYVYKLMQAANGNWYLAGINQASSSGTASVGAFTAGYLLNYAETQTLRQRLGDLHHGEVPGDIWARVYGGKFSAHSGSTVSGFGMPYHGLQVGLDRKVGYKNGQGTAYTGGVLGFATANQHYGAGSGSNDSVTLGLYKTYIDPQDRYADVVVKYGWMNGDYQVRDTAANWVNGDKMHTRGGSVSLEAGRRLYQDKTTKQGWYFEPQAQFSVGLYSGGSFNASNGLKVNVDGYRSVVGRLGMVVGHEIKQGNHPVHAYGKVSYLKEFDGDIKFKMNGSRAEESMGGCWWSYGAGVTTQLANDRNIYFDVTRASGGSFTQSWQLNLGLRGTW